jgi:TRAP-type C4-dicarboxylate transport system permease small subunit
MLGASIVNRKDEHTNVTYFVNKLPKSLNAFLYIIREVFILILLIILIYYGILLSYTMRTVKTAALDWSWAFLYTSLPAGCLLMIFSTVQLIAKKLEELKNPARREGAQQ